MSRKKIIVSIAVAIAVLIYLGIAQRVRDYKQVIKDMEQATNICSNSPDTSRFVRMIGKPDKLYYQLSITPKYRHFWE